MVADVGMREYEQRMVTLRTLIDLWTRHEQVTVVPISVQADDAEELVSADQDDEAQDPEPVSAHQDDSQELAALGETEEQDPVSADQDNEPEELPALGETEDPAPVSAEQDNDSQELAAVGETLVSADHDRTDDLGPVSADQGNELEELPAVGETEDPDPVSADQDSNAEEPTASTECGEPGHLAVTSGCYTQAVASEFTNTLQLPPAVKRRGRPKGCNTTVVGLPKAKRYKKTLSAFTELSKLEQQTSM